MITGFETGWLKYMALAALPILIMAAWAIFIIIRLQGAVARERRASAILAMEAERREMRLQEILAAHDLLTREFHHRVKNSLQIIQSYLTLSRRQKLPPFNIHLAEVEAKVQVISAAYRLALSDGEIRPVTIPRFVQDIVEGTQGILCGPFTKISILIAVEGTLVLDRIIPMGLSIVEVMIGALGDPANTLVKIVITTAGPREITLAISTDAEHPNVTLPVRLMQGFQAQLGATAETCQPQELLRWRFSTDTDPMANRNRPKAEAHPHDRADPER